MGEIKINPLFNVHNKYNRVNIVNPYRFSSGGGASYEPETLAYMASVGIADDATVYYAGTAQEKTGNGFYMAVDNFIKSLKTEGVFAKLKAVYPMIGGNASTHKWNLINPQDTDAAFRMLWYGSGVHSKTGWKGNGTDAYGDTRFNQSLYSALNNESVGIYRTIHIQGSARDFGAYNAQGTIITSHFSSTQNHFYSQSAGNTFLNTDGLGLNAVSRTIQGSVIAQAKANQSVNTLNSSGLVNATFYLGSLNTGTSAYTRTFSEFSYAFIGEGLTQAQMSAHYNAVQQLQTDLGRQV